MTSVSYSACLRLLRVPPVMETRALLTASRVSIHRISLEVSQYAYVGRL